MTAKKAPELVPCRVAGPYQVNVDGTVYETGAEVDLPGDLATSWAALGYVIPRNPQPTTVKTSQKAGSSTVVAEQNLVSSTIKSATIPPTVP